MTTPTQPKRVIETPFGTATITDSRYYADHKDHRPRLAYIAFDKGLTVNRKDYKGVSFELQRGWTSEEPYHVSPMGYNYRELTESARDKVRAYFAQPEHREIFTPFLEELDAADIRRQIKSSLHHHIAGELHKQEGNGDYPQSARNGLVKELMTEILNDALAWAAEGKSYSSFYFDGGK